MGHKAVLGSDQGHYPGHHCGQWQQCVWVIMTWGVPSSAQGLWASACHFWALLWSYGLSGAVLCTQCSIAAPPLEFKNAVKWSWLLFLTSHVWLRFRFLGEAIATAVCYDGWSKQRKVTAPMFNHTKALTYIESINKPSYVQAAVWSQKVCWIRKEIPPRKPHRKDDPRCDSKCRW